VPNKHTIKIIALSKGPDVEIITKEGGKILDFNSVQALSSVPKKIRIINKCTIEADFNVFTKNPNSIFKPLTRHDVLAPNTETEIDIMCSPDDTGKF
jgi:hypothetical protein